MLSDSRLLIAPGRNETTGILFCILMLSPPMVLVVMSAKLASEERRGARGEVTPRSSRDLPLSAASPLAAALKGFFKVGSEGRWVKIWGRPTLDQRSAGSVGSSVRPSVHKYQLVGFVGFAELVRRLTVASLGVVLAVLLRKAVGPVFKVVAHGVAVTLGTAHQLFPPYIPIRQDLRGQRSHQAVEVDGGGSSVEGACAICQLLHTITRAYGAKERAATHMRGPTGLCNHLVSISPAIKAPVAMTIGKRDSPKANWILLAAHQLCAVHREDEQLTQTRHDLAAVPVEVQAHADQAREGRGGAKLARSAGHLHPLEVRHAVAEEGQPRLEVGVAERLQGVRVLQAPNGGVQAKANHGDDVHQARKEDELAARPEIPGAEGKEEEDGDEDAERDEAGQLGEPL